MENEQVQDPVDQSENASGNSDQKDVVAYDSFQKVLNEKKQMQAKFNETQERLKQLEEEKLKAEGNKDQLIENYKKQLEETKAKLNKTQQTYGWNSVSNTIKQIAKDMGANTPTKQEAVLRLMGDDYLQRIQADESFNVDIESARSVLEEWKKENSDLNLFESPSKKMANGNPITKVETQKTDDLSKLSREQILERLKQTYK